MLIRNVRKKVDSEENSVAEIKGEEALLKSQRDWYKS